MRSLTVIVHPLAADGRYTAALSGDLAASPGEKYELNDLESRNRSNPAIAKGVEKLFSFRVGPISFVVSLRIHVVDPIWRDKCLSMNSGLILKFYEVSFDE